MSRTVYFVSDHTGVTAEVLGHSLLARFEERDLVTTTRPFVNNIERAEELVAEMAALPVEPIVFSTITEPAVRERISAAVTHHFDLVSPFLDPLEQVFGYPAATESAQRTASGTWLATRRASMPSSSPSPPTTARTPTATRRPRR